MKPADSPQPGLRHPGRHLWLLLLLPIALGLSRLRFDVEVFDLLPGDLSAVAGLKLYQENFANARELVITVQAKDAAQAEAAARAMADSLRGHQDVAGTVTWEPPWLEHPEQAAELVAYLWFNQPPDQFRELARRLAPDKLPDTLAAAHEELATSLSPGEIARLSYDPFGLTRLPESAAVAAPSFGQGQEMFSSRDGTFRMVFVGARGELRTYRECDQWLRRIKAIAGGAVSSKPDLAGVALGYTGRPAFVAEIARGMERDITTSVGGTAVIIAILFWLAHRRIKPMLWLLTLLTLILGSTLALGGLFFGAINVVSMGFAAILLGLAVDYAVVHYQEALAHPNLTIPQIRHAIAPSIFWAAVTTISAFLVLNFGGLPGLGQLGTLVGLGVALAALIMVFEFLPPLFPERREASASYEAANERQLEPERRCPRPNGLPTLPRPAGFAITAVLVILVATILLRGLPEMDSTANALRPRNSAAYAAVDQIQTRLSQKREPLWLIVGGTNVAKNLQEAQSVLSNAVANHLIAGFTLPTPLWPRPEFQGANRSTARELAGDRGALRRAALAGGFTEISLALTERVLDTWQIGSQTSGAFWPTNPVSQWVFAKLAARRATNYFALGLINQAPTTIPGTRELLEQQLKARLPHQPVWLSGWESLGSAILGRVKANIWKVVGPMIGLVLLSLFLAFRRPREIVLSLAVLLLSGLCLLSLMRLTGWSWNLLNLMGIPLVLGTGVDYGIFMQLALRRYQGDLDMTYRSVGRALLLCGGTAIAAFGSLGFSSNTGMASLGRVCAVGIGANMLIAIFLLPLWWEAVHGRNPRVANRRPKEEAAGAENPRLPSRILAPSLLYRRECWQLGLWVVRRLPPRTCARLGRHLAGAYWVVAPHRRAVVIQNLLPALNGDGREAEQKAKDLFRQFAVKLIDLWRCEAGLPIDDLFGETTGWEYFKEAQAQHRGVLLLTPHLGNWEFGGPLLARKGVALQVITLAEPSEDFTRLRRDSRARWNIETLVIRNDPLAFLEIIRRLEGGATVALLVDRPPPPTATTVELFGRPFPASIAAAELARASGCVLLPVYLPRRGEGYDAHILPPIGYQRAALRDRAARQQLTQQIVTTFEPLISQHLDQWYHFVPVWGSKDCGCASDYKIVEPLKNQ